MQYTNTMYICLQIVKRTNTNTNTMRLRHTDNYTLIKESLINAVEDLTLITTKRSRRFLALYARKKRCGQRNGWVWPSTNTNSWNMSIIIYLIFARFRTCLMWRKDSCRIVVLLLCKCPLNGEVIGRFLLEKPRYMCKRTSR